MSDRGVNAKRVCIECGKPAEFRVRRANRWHEFYCRACSEGKRRWKLKVPA